VDAGEPAARVDAVKVAHDHLFDEHGIQVYPTVLFFKAGKMHKRLEGKHLAGLKEKQLTELIASC
jgi:hypothetical protein